MVPDAAGAETYIAGVGTVELKRAHKLEERKMFCMFQMLSVMDFAVGFIVPLMAGRPASAHFSAGPMNKTLLLVWRARGLRKLVLAGDPQGC